MVLLSNIISVNKFILKKYKKLKLEKDLMCLKLEFNNNRLRKKDKKNIKKYVKCNYNLKRAKSVEEIKAIYKKFLKGLVENDLVKKDLGEKDLEKKDLKVLDIMENILKRYKDYLDTYNIDKTITLALAILSIGLSIISIQFDNQNKNHNENNIQIQTIYQDQFNYQYQLDNHKKLDNQSQWRSSG